MRLLTGAPGSTSDGSFEFVPDSVTSVGSIVLAEGCDQNRSIYWAHAWTVADGIITQVREYFNTSLTVTRLGGASRSSSPPPPSSSALGSEIAPASAPAPGSQHCPSIWESSLSNRVGKSVPGLVLAI
ncbi:wound-induced protein 1 [Syzygium oleosum]|uniref:wound-induced protein 1 n=1 Tax=Syzygium oleosum TaxID=219896 RepID=UPI0011D17E11|nr:wound-induced protein 1 [Syzygium oleosum]